MSWSCHIAGCNNSIRHIENRFQFVTLQSAAAGRIQWHVIPEPRITLQGAATWWIHCHDSRATCHIAGCNNSIRHIENRFLPHFSLFFWFLMQFGLWRAADFVSSPIHLLVLTYASGCSWWLHDVIRSFWSLEHKQLSTTCLASCQTQKHWKYKLPCCKSANQLHNRKFSLALIKV